MKKSISARRLLILSLIAAIAVPILNTVLLGSLTTVLASDVMIPAAASAVTSFLSELITLAAAFAAAACLSYAGASCTLRREIAIITALSVPVTYLAAGIVDIAFYGKTVLNGAYLAYSAVSCLFELLRYALILAAALLIARVGARRSLPMNLELLSVSGILSCSALSAAVLTGLSMLLTNLSETVSLLTKYGAPVNTSETLTLVSPFITTVIFTILGYFLSYLMHKFIRHSEPDAPMEESK